MVINNHPYYNTTNFPRLVWAQKNSNWHVYANKAGKCASIPVKPGCLASDFGDLAHVAKMKRYPHRDLHYAMRVKKWKAMGF